MNTTNRLVSVDVFRGLTIAAMILVNYPGSYENTYGILEHSHWNGITPTDLIFPFFIFIMGVSITLSFTKQLEAGNSHKEMVTKVFVRFVKIYMIGLLIHYLPDFDFSKIDLFGVLQRISLVYLACALLFIYTGWKKQISIFSGILLVYWITLSFIPTDTFSAGTIEPGLNFAAWFDRLIFSADMLGKHGWNSEGLYSTLPAIASGIAGMQAGRLVISRNISEKSVIWLCIAGVLLVFAGGLWDLQFPINKKVWTSSYVLYSSGWASMILALSVWFIDFMNFKHNVIARAGIIFGTNAIAIYVMADVFETIYKYSHIHDLIYNGLTQAGMAEKTASLLWGLISVSSCFLVAYGLYRRKIVIKL
jgi:predicted acyltransferase